MKGSTPIEKTTDISSACKRETAPAANKSVSQSTPMKLLFIQFPKIPFTCSYLPGAARIVFFYPLYFLGFACFGYEADNLEIWLAHDSRRFPYFYGVAAALFLWIIRHNARWASQSIRFEEESQRAAVYLDLRR
jgi:hypothetical protein